jgi:hypothetical protein
MIRIACLAATLALGITSAAFAQQGSQTAAPGQGPLVGKLREACAADVQKYCPDKQPGPDRRACMRENQAKLTDACKSAMADARAAAGAARRNGGGE